MLRANLLGTGEIGNRAADFGDPIAMYANQSELSTLSELIWLIIKKIMRSVTKAIFYSLLSLNALVFIVGIFDFLTMNNPQSDFYAKLQTYDAHVKQTKIFDHFYYTGFTFFYSVVCVGILAFKRWARSTMIFLPIIMIFGSIVIHKLFVLPTIKTHPTPIKIFAGLIMLAFPSIYLLLPRVKELFYE